MRPLDNPPAGRLRRTVKSPGRDGQNPSGLALACPPPKRSSPRVAPRHDDEGKLIKHAPPIGASTSDFAYIGDYWIPHSFGGALWNR
jgi:hypothetical protein